MSILYDTTTSTNWSNSVFTLDDLKRTVSLIQKPPPGQFNGEIIESIHMVDGPFEDWSKVRSPARARRRRAKHQQNITFYYVPKPDFVKLPNGTMVGHPVTVRALRDRIKQNMARTSDEIVRRALYQGV